MKRFGAINVYSKGIFLLDIEVELAWGMTHMRTDADRLRKASESARDHLREIFDLLEKHRISVTWGILGHLLSESCRSKREPSFYGKDIVDRIVDFALKARVPQDIACHSYSHRLLGDQACSKEVADFEVKRSIELLEENYHIVPKVFIFPRDEPGHLDILHKYSFACFRGPTPHFIDYSKSQRGIWNLTRQYLSLGSYLVSFYLAVPPPVVVPLKQGGMTNIPASMSYNKKPFVPLELVTLKAKQGIRRAIIERKVVHLSMHLINFGEVSSIKKFFKGFEEILTYTDLCRKEGKLEVLTMKRIAETLQATPSTSNRDQKTGS